VTPRGKHASLRVDASGAFEPMADWPSPIVGEVYGPHGAIAWTFTSPASLLFRETPSSAVVSVPVPFQTYTAVWWQNQVLLTADTGVWSWQPGEAPHQLTPLPRGVIVGVSDRGLRVDPLAVVAGRPGRVRMVTGWDVDIATGGVTDRVLRAPGQAWSKAQSETITATTYPQADVVKLTMTTGLKRWLIWPSPRTAIWVNTSLILNSTDGTVVVFPELMSTLETTSPA
jgi:hypothetical protein